MVSLIAHWPVSALVPYPYHIFSFAGPSRQSHITCSASSSLIGSSNGLYINFVNNIDTIISITSSLILFCLSRRAWSLLMFFVRQLPNPSRRSYYWNSLRQQNTNHAGDKNVSHSHQSYRNLVDHGTTQASQEAHIWPSSPDGMRHQLLKCNLGHVCATSIIPYDADFITNSACLRSCPKYNLWCWSMPPSCDIDFQVTENNQVSTILNFWVLTATQHFSVNFQHARLQGKVYTVVSEGNSESFWHISCLHPGLIMCSDVKDDLLRCQSWQYIQYMTCIILHIGMVWKYNYTCRKQWKAIWTTTSTTGRKSHWTFYHTLEGLDPN